MRVVADTVILVRALISPYSWWGRFLFDHMGVYRLSVSPPVLAEYLEVTRRPALVRKYRQVAARDPRAVLTWLAEAEVVQLAAIPTVCRDPEDDKFLATAKAGRAAFIVSEDNDLLALETYDGIKIVTVAAFLAILEAEAGLA